MSETWTGKCRRPLVRITVGLPGCGKTSWARAEIQRHLDAGEDPKRLVRLSRDDMRAMMTVGYGPTVPTFENIITDMIDAALILLLIRRVDVILDATNLNPGYLRAQQATIERGGGRWELVDFTDVPLETCIERDAQRTGSARVGEDVIRSMAKRYLS
jgi:tRNA uridine 5-carbamoylmethylation protein Kti12